MTDKTIHISKRGSGYSKKLNIVDANNVFVGYNFSAS